MQYCEAMGYRPDDPAAGALIRLQILAQEIPTSLMYEPCMHVTRARVNNNVSRSPLLTRHISIVVVLVVVLH